MADNEVVLGLNLDISKVQKALYDMIGNFTGTGKEFDKVTSNIEKSFKNLEAVTKRYGITSQEAETASRNYQRALNSLVANGIDPASAHFKTLEGAANGANNAVNNSQGNVKKTNQAWSNLALVVQDLPYGFRGIQNNLPALFGSIAAAAGPAYFAFSALIALVTAYEKEIKSLFITTSDFEKQQELYNNVVKESGSAYVNAETQVLSLTQKIKLAEQGFISKQSVVNEYNETIGKTIGQQKTLEGVNQALINQGPAYVDYMNKISMAVAASKLVAQQTELIVKTSAKSATEFVGGWEAFFSAKFNVGGLAQSLIASADALTKVAEKNRKTQLAEQEKVKAGYIKIQDDMYKQAGIAAKKAGVVAGVDTAGLKDLEKQRKDRLKAIQDANDAEVKAYLQTIDERGQKEYKAGLELADNLEKMKAAGYKDSTTYYSAYKAEMAKIDQHYNDLELKRAKKLADEVAREKKQASDRELQNSLDALKIQASTEEKILNKKDKGNTAGRIKILEDYKRGLIGLALAGNYTSEQLDKIQDVLNNVDAAIVGSKDVLKSYKVSWTDTLNTINGSIVNFVNNSLFFLAESLGKALAGENIDVFNGLAMLLADSLVEIGKALITYAALAAAATLAMSDPLTWPVALAAGIAAVAAGAFLKSKLSQKKTNKFANGGVISGPTYGLMGEYPGAQSNPEVVAPLDKLKDMMGGGSGQFVLRGNDLVLALQRSNYSLNLRRGS